MASAEAAAGKVAGEAAASSKFASFKKFINFVAPPLAGCAVGWTVWGAGEFVAPDYMHTTAIRIHNVTYKGQELPQDNILPRSVAEAMIKQGLCIPPPVNILEQDRDEENQSQSQTMFREIFEQCRMQEGLDWLEENVTEEIPFIYINELFATWGNTFFWKHFLNKKYKKNNNKNDSSGSEGGLETTHAQDLKTLSKRVENDYGDCDVHLAPITIKVKQQQQNDGEVDENKEQQQEQGQEEVEQEVNLPPIRIKSGGEAMLIEGIWRRFALMEQLDSVAGWSTLAVLTQNKQNALALAKIALVSTIANQPEHESVLFASSSSNNDAKQKFEQSKTLLCDADRCLWALASLLQVGLQKWTVSNSTSTDNESSNSPAMMSDAALSKKPYLVATATIDPKEEEKERKRKLRKEQSAGRSNPYAEEEEAEGGLYREEKENRAFMQLVMSKLDELIMMEQNNKNKIATTTSENNSSSKIDPELVNPDHLEKHKQREENTASWEVETERRWAIAATDPFLVTLRNVDNALCEYLKKGEDKATVSRWFDLFVGGMDEKKHDSRCPNLKKKQTNLSVNGDDDCAKNAISELSSSSSSSQQRFRFSASTSTSTSTLIPSVFEQFKNSSSSRDFPAIFTKSSSGGTNLKQRLVLSDYVGKQFANAVTNSTGELPFGSSASADDDTENKKSSSLLKQYDLNENELLAAAGFLRKQSAIVKSWVKENEM